MVRRASDNTENARLLSADQIDLLTVLVRAAFTRAWTVHEGQTLVTIWNRLGQAEQPERPEPREWR